jgi:membrane-bound lytic murein transglycosylase F
MDQMELLKFTLAAYNAGEGRIADCRNFAAEKGYDKNSWNDIEQIIPMMRDDSILEEASVKLGKFQGYETIAYVESILKLYEAVCTICPEA